MQSSRISLKLIEHASKQFSKRKLLISTLLPKSALPDSFFRVVASNQFRHFSTPAINPLTDPPKTVAVESEEKPLDPPVYEGEEKVYPVKLKKLVDEISRLSLLEVTEFNELLKKTLKISDLPLMQAGAAPVAQKEEAEEEAEVKQVKSSFTVRILKFEEAKKVALIKEVKAIVPGMNLVQAKKFVESVPSVVGTDIAKEDAEKLKEKLTAVGAFVEIE